MRSTRLPHQIAYVALFASLSLPDGWNLYFGLAHMFEFDYVVRALTLSYPESAIRDIGIASFSIRAMDPTIRDISEQEVDGCYPLVAQLRPHLKSSAEFVMRWRRQASDGYRLMGMFEGPRPVALAGFRIQENLVYGRFLYVDDLITDGGERSKGYGEQLLSRLKEEAQLLKCNRLVLDTPLSNSLGQRFYFRNGLLATALRFNFEVSHA